MLLKEKDMKRKKIVNVKDKQKKQKLVDRRQEYGKYVNRYYLPKIDQSHDHNASHAGEVDRSRSGHHQEPSGYMDAGRQHHIERQIDDDDDIYEHMAEINDGYAARDVLEEANNAREPEIGDRAGSSSSKKSKKSGSQTKQIKNSAPKSAEKKIDGQVKEIRKGSDVKEPKKNLKDSTAKVTKKSEAKVNML